MLTSFSGNYCKVAILTGSLALSCVAPLLSIADMYQCSFTYQLLPMFYPVALGHNVCEFLWISLLESEINHELSFMHTLIWHQCAYWDSVLSVWLAWPLVNVWEHYSGLECTTDMHRDHSNAAMCANREGSQLFTCVGHCAACQVFRLVHRYDWNVPSMKSYIQLYPAR